MFTNLSLGSEVADDSDLDSFHEEHSGGHQLVVESGSCESRFAGVVDVAAHYGNRGVGDEGGETLGLVVELVVAQRLEKEQKISLRLY